MPSKNAQALTAVTSANIRREAQALMAVALVGIRRKAQAELVVKRHVQRFPAGAWCVLSPGTLLGLKVLAVGRRFTAARMVNKALNASELNSKPPAFLAEAPPSRWSPVLRRQGLVKREHKKCQRVVMYAIPTA